MYVVSHTPYYWLRFTCDTHTLKLKRHNNMLNKKTQQQVETEKRNSKVEKTRNRNNSIIILLQTYVYIIDVWGPHHSDPNRNT